MIEIITEVMFAIMKGFFQSLGLCFYCLVEHTVITIIITAIVLHQFL
ncbi:Uncharacterised protein [Streptococcus dysgalactiae subsp. equisimilis]|uniref:Uncharacterized protein n=1 Tax=Streptococcus dysgalactiae TaxID=1334 RepID=A0A9X9QRZ8_STRDY|nr:Uncharacterised protein [Streptococcus dysgalactiae subsp. equisimilis]VTS42563.1 Uncharacterised protein [Streptococcus dysgalactiae subsp. equisimilis]VTS87751.1 Uncharacterised protein [Streptococcus dysgalactiae]